jgi:methionyl-tRNA formyltransferase
VVEWAMFNNDKVIGTIHLIDSGIDTGQILLEEELDINTKSDYIVARESAFDQVIKLAGKTVLNLAEGKIKPIPQPKEGKRWYTMHPFFHHQLNQILKSRTT